MENVINGAAEVDNILLFFKYIFSLF